MECNVIGQIFSLQMEKGLDDTGPLYMYMSCTFIAVHGFSKTTIVFYCKLDRRFRVTR